MGKSLTDTPKEPEEPYRFTRAAKHVGGFGEDLVTYALIRSGYEVATVDHVGADLIAERGGGRYAVSVKSRMYREKSKESRGVLFSDRDIEKLNEFAHRFGLRALFAHVCSIVDDRRIHVVMFPIEIVPEVMKKVQHGFRKDIRDLIEDDRVSYSCWIEDCLDTHAFDQ
jgi:hypothetical protein